MHTTIKFTGVLEQILEEAVDEGIAKTKTQALRLAVLELNNKYHLLEKSREDELALRKMQRMEEEIASGKRKLLTLAEVKKKYPGVTE